MIAYLDTNVAARLAEMSLSGVSREVERLIREAELLLSPMVLIELEYMYEIGRVQWRSSDIQMKIEHEAMAKVCTLPFSTVARIAVDESWTRDPFDRIIVAQAKANGLAFLISSDERIAKHYARTVW